MGKLSTAWTLAVLVGCGSSGRSSLADAPVGTMDVLWDGPSDGSAVDAPTIDGVSPDAPIDAYVPCSMLGTECIPGALLTCTQTGQNPTWRPCAWGCVSTPSPHCGELHPAGGALVVTDLHEDLALSSIAILSATTINSNTGEIAGVRAAGTGVLGGIDYSVRNGIGTFRMRDLDIRGTLTVVGSNAIAIAVTHDMKVSAFVDVSVGTCAGSAQMPGGGPGGAPGVNGAGTGRGSAGVGSNANVGGGGGAHGGNGGKGGDAYDIDGNLQGMGGAGGNAFGDDAITLLRGGSGGGGGGGGGAMGGEGGAGGGAIQLVANGDMTIGISMAMIRAEGCLGTPITSGFPVEGGGGGGGAGGTILLEASRIFANGNAYLLAYGGNGGNHGGGDGGSSPQFGSMNDGNYGDPGMNAGGGGGGTGRIRVNSPGGASFVTTQTVPALGVVGSTGTVGTGDIR